jgi:crotonyl-CoA carboxylase/reductase
MEERRSVVTNGSEPVPIGSVPPLGKAPRQMYARVVRPSRCETRCQVRK